MNKNEVKSSAYQKRLSTEAAFEIFENSSDIFSDITSILEDSDGDAVQKIWSVFLYGVAYEQERMHTKELMSI